MAILGLVMIFLGGIIGISGGFLYNYYKDKSGAEKHTEIISKQNELGGKIDNTQRAIIEKLDTPPALNNENVLTKEKKVTQERRLPSKNNEEKAQTKNQIINNAPNQGVQINENNGTVIIPASSLKKPPRRFDIDDAKKALNGYPLDFPIEIILKGTDEESKALYDQVLSAVQNLGYKNISKTVIGMYLSVGEVIENDFNYKIDNGKLVFSIYLQKE